MLTARMHALHTAPSSDTFVLLSSPGTIGAKTWTPAGESAYDAGFGPFQVHNLPCASLADLAEILRSCPFNAFHVRGRTIDPGAVQIPYRRIKTHMKEGRSEPPTLTEQAHHVIPVDFDGKDEKAPPMSDLYEAARQVREILPWPFNGAECVAQATSGSGIKPGLRVRLWFFADRPAGDAELKRLFANTPGLDTAIYNPAQPIWVTHPRFIGVQDPFPRRWVHLDGAALSLPEVMVPPVPEAHTPSAWADAFKGASEHIVQGDRANTLTSIAGSMRARGLSPVAIAAALHEHNRTHVVPPLSAEDVDNIAHSIGSYAPREMAPPPKDDAGASRELARQARRLADDPGLLVSCLGALKVHVCTGALTEPQVVTRLHSVLRKADTPVAKSDIERHLRAIPEPEVPVKPAWQLKLATNAEGGVKVGAANLATILRECPDFSLWYDVRARRAEITKAPWVSAGRSLDEHDGSYLREWLDAKMGWSTCPEEPLHALGKVAQERSWDPWVQGYLDQLTWDGTPRLISAARRLLGAQTDRESICFAWWLLSAVARSYAPGCQADCMIVLEGHQGWGKTSFLRELAVAPRYYGRVATKESLQNPRVIAALQGPVLMEIAELASLSRRDVEATKEFLDCTVDTWIPLHARFQRSDPRRCVFAGTTNQDDYLNDITGARRIWPIRLTQRVDIPAVRAERDQLWAEAVAYYRQGMRWYATDAEAEALGMAEAVEARRAPEIAEETFTHLLTQKFVAGIARDGLAAPEQWMLNTQGELIAARGVWLREALKLTQEQARFMGKSLKACGWEPATKWIDGRKTKIWRRNDDTHARLIKYPPRPT